MSEMKPTPGPWIAVKYSAKRFGLGTAGDGAWMYLQTIYQDADHPEMRANARLIAEAGTVFHHTGLSPGQLVEMVKELKEALCLMVRTHDEPAESLLQEVKEQQWLDKARAALAKCEGVK